MGSKCSILNDTKHDVWIKHGIHWPVLFASVTAALLAVLSAGGIALATYGVEGAVVGSGGLLEGFEGIGTLTAGFAGVKSQQKRIIDAVLDISAGFAGVKLDAQQKRIIDAVLDISDLVLSKILKTSRKEAGKLQADIKDFQKSAVLVKPGDKYTWYGSLSLVMKVYIVNDKLQLDERGCFTGPTHGSENVYPISEYFEKLAVAD